MKHKRRVGLSAAQVLYLTDPAVAIEWPFTSEAAAREAWRTHRSWLFPLYQAAERDAEEFSRRQGGSYRASERHWLD